MDWLFHRFSSASSFPCLATAEKEHTYGELLACISLAESELDRAEVPAGAVVAVLADYSLCSIGWFLALGRRKCILVPVSPSALSELAGRLAAAAVEWRLDFAADAGPQLQKLTRTETPPLLRQLREGGRAGLVLFSSGTTGEPKAMVHDLTTLIDSYAERRTRQLRILLFLLFDHIGGLNTLLHALASSLCIVLPETRQPEEIASLIERRKVNVLPASPTFLNLLLLSDAHQRRDLSSLRIITYGTEAMPQPLLNRLRSFFPKVRFVQTFGTSETGISQTVSESSGSTRMKIEDPNVETRIVDGELWLRTKTQILGYLNQNPDNFTADGWFRTGDLVETREDGYLRIIGRSNEAINVGGLKVLPGEVETVLLEMPQIADCLIYAEPNSISGQVVAAQVVLSRGSDPSHIKSEIRAHCRGRLEAYKVPVRVWIVNQTSFSSRFKKSRLAPSETAERVGTA